MKNSKTNKRGCKFNATIIEGGAAENLQGAMNWIWSEDFIENFEVMAKI